MENFFYNDKFYGDLDDLISDLDLGNDGAIALLEETWKIEVEDSKLEKIFKLEEKFVINAVLEQTDTWEERFPEDSDHTFEQIKKAIKGSIDIDKLNSLLPELYYLNGEKFEITKQDLLNHIC